jgi:integrase
MARPHKPWYRAPRQTWYVEIDGKQIPLVKGPKAVTQKEAYTAFNKLMEHVDAPEGNVRQDTIISIFGRFLSWSKKNKSPATYEQRRYFLKSFLNHPGAKRLRPERVTVDFVESWLDAHPKWKASRRHAILTLQGLFNWAVKRGNLSKNPITGIEIPAKVRVVNYLTTEQRREIFDSIKDVAFRQFLTALQETGCRPGEVSKVEAVNANVDVGVWVLVVHKTGKKTGKPRTVYLTEKMVALTRELIEKNPSGPLFLNSRHQPWNRNSIRCRFRTLRKTFPKFGHFTAYSFRRAFVTDALERGVDIAQVAELVGHTSTDMVMRHYNQLQERVVHMREMAAKATR